MLSVCLSVKIMHVCDLTCINLKMICDFPFLPFSQLSDEPLPGMNKLSIIGRNAASSFDQFFNINNISVNYFNSHIFVSKHNQRKTLLLVECVW